MLYLLFAICSTFVAFAAPPTKSDLEKPLSKITFGSCYRAHNGHSKLWPLIIEEDSDLWIWMGDSYYADKWRSEPATTKEEFFDAQKLNFETDELYKELTSKTPVVAIWDDHDYGQNNGGADYEFKEESKEIFLDFYQEPEKSPRRSREGIYTSYMFGPKGKRVQIILLDLRTFRSPLKEGERLADPSRGKCLPEESASATMLGEAQWDWLAKELEKEADLRVIGSSVQFVSEFDGWEAWANFPKEKKKFVELVKAKKAEGVVFISGDAHKGELHLQEFDGCYSFWDLTSSSLISGVPHNETQTLCGVAYDQPNYGMLRINWSRREVVMEVKGADKVAHIHKAIKFDTLTFDSKNLEKPDFDDALGAWRHRFGTFYLTKKAPGVFVNQYVDRGRSGTIELIKEGDYLVGVREVGEEKGVCKFRATKDGKFLQAIYSKDSNEPLYDWNGWREVPKK